MAKTSKKVKATPEAKKKPAAKPEAPPKNLKGVLSDMVVGVHLPAVPGEVTEKFLPDYPEFDVKATTTFRSSAAKPNFTELPSDRKKYRPSRLILPSEKPAEAEFAVVAEVEAPVTPERAALDEAIAALGPLMTQTKYRELAGSMIAFRRAYTVAYRELQELLAADAPDVLLLEDVIVGSAMHAANQGFDEHELVSGFVEVVLPWLGGVVDRHTAQDNESVRAAREDADKVRRGTPVPIGLRTNLESEESAIGRDRPLVLVGWKPIVLWLLDRVTTFALTANGKRLLTVVRFSDHAPRSASDVNLIRLGKSAWKGCADSRDAVKRVMGQYVAEKLTYNPDLFVVDDLAGCFTRGFVGRPDAANAGDANKHMARWCKEAACALVGAVATDGEAVDVSGSQWEQLKTFSDLRVVTAALVTDGPGDAEGDHYKIVIGNNADTLYVPAAAIEAYRTSKLILPSGGITE